MIELRRGQRQRDICGVEVGGGASSRKELRGGGLGKKSCCDVNIVGT